MRIPRLAFVAFPALVGAGLRAPCANAQSSLTALPNLGNGFFEPTGAALDGNTVVGGSYIAGLGNKARRWRAGFGYDDPAPDVSLKASWSSACSANGQVVVGGTGHAAFGDLEGWMRIGTSTGHVGTPSGHDTSDLLGVSSDGSVGVGYGGYQSNPNLFEAGWYTEASDWHNLGWLPGGNNSQALAANTDGSVIVGWSNDAALSSSIPFRWTQATGMVALWPTPSGTDGRATGVSADGSVVVGYDDVSSWMWTASGGMQSLGTVSGGLDNYAQAVSYDGTLVSGYVNHAGGYEAFLWDAAHGMRLLRDVLLDEGVAEASAWTFETAHVAGAGPWIVTGGGFDAGPSDSGYFVHFDPSASPFEVECRGDGSGAACPCGNFGGSGQGCANSLGAGATLSGSGSVSVVADDLLLSASGLPLGVLGLVFMGSGSAGGGLGVPFGDGLRCPSGVTHRFGVQSSGSGGAIALLGAAGQAPTLITPGSSWTFQAWYRDPSGPCGPGYNVSNGLRTTFAP